MVDLAGVVFHTRVEKSEYENETWRPRRAERVGAYDGKDLVGQLAAFPARLAVPGAVLDCSAVTLVGVLPTHRRRGVLTSMMDRMHADAVAAGRPVAALWASQSVIYGRYGFGAATRSIDLEVDSSRELRLRTEPDPAPLRLLDTASAPEILDPIYTRALSRRPGSLLRDPEWWSRSVLPSTDREAPGFTEPRVVVHPAGYAVYRTDSEKTVRLDELFAETPQVEAALWRYLASVDLTTRIQAHGRPVDDLLPRMAVDPDQVSHKGEWAALWLRLVDVPAALRSRSWAADDAFVLEVRDPRVPANEGRWRLRVGAAPACDRTEEPPDLTLSAADLAAVYLGGTPVTTLVRIGAVTEHTPEAAARLDAALAVPFAPYIADQF